MNDFNRRDFLKFGTALPLALQTIAARAGEKPASVTPPKRIIFLCNSLGFYEPNFFPADRGDIETSNYLKEMATKDKMTVLQNLFHPGMETSNHDSEKSFLTGAVKPESPNFVNTISADQILAEKMGGDTRFPFLSFSIYDRGWGCSWNNRGVAIPPMHDESAIFEMLFGKQDLAAKRRQLETDRQIIRSLNRDMQRLRESGDVGKIDSYRTVIAELESSFRREQFWLETEKPRVPNTLIEDQEFVFSAKIRNLLELARLAFQTDSTRVITLSLDWIYGAIKVPGATGGWHTLSHHGGKPDVLEKLCRVEADIIKHLNEFLVAMDGIKEGAGTLLDHTPVIIGSNVGDSSNHTCNNLPTIVAGGGYRHQSHTVLEKPTPLCNLWLELLHKHDIDAGKFGTSQIDQQPLLT
ncbi:MAG: DUF1552 domain-containing protein [Rubripirellula sp.]|nr:DUF1552 domain-containing protein [Rubripirellula sp.]